MTKNSSRRTFLKTATLVAGSVGAIGMVSCKSDTSTSQQEESEDVNSNDLKLTVAGYEFNRLKALIDGRVKIEGCDISFTKSSIGNMNTDTFSGAQTYDITEIGLHPFMLAYANNEFRDYSLLPVFPLRIFRHKSVFIRNDRGIKKPEDLRGKTIGTAGYSSTSLTWLRGIFQDEYGIKPEDVKWVISNKDSSADMAGKISKQEQVAPEGISLKTGTPGLDESELLVSGEVDALFHAAEPKAYIDGNPLVERMDYEYMKKMAWLYDSLPWYGQELEETQKVMGTNFWTYGMDANRKTLEALFRYSHEQGLSSRELTIEELFHPSSYDLNELN
jgi:4,5-dihydroxyphthalate decarboxylase